MSSRIVAFNFRSLQDHQTLETLLDLSPLLYDCERYRRLCALAGGSGAVLCKQFDGRITESYFSDRPVGPEPEDWETNWSLVPNLGCVFNAPDFALGVAVLSGAAPIPSRPAFGRTVKPLPLP